MADAPSGPRVPTSTLAGHGGLGPGGGVPWFDVARTAVSGPPTAARARDKFNRCVMLEFDAEKHRWRDVLRRTPRAAAASAMRRTPSRGLPQVRQEAERAHSARGAESPWVPVATGLALLVAPPVGVAMVWSSRRYDATAKVALTIFSGFTMCLAAIVAIFAML